MRAVSRLCLLLLLGWLVPAEAQVSRLTKPAFPLSVTLDQSGAPVLSWSSPDHQPLRQRLLLRSTVDLRISKDPVLCPITALDCHSFPTGYRDTQAAQDVPLFYQLMLVYEDGRVVYSTVAQVTSPAPAIPPLARPSIYIDKAQYTLSLLDDGVAVRRFPVALGANPVRRKLHLDRASTPEGIYRICGVQPQAEFYKAFDLNYPNEVDKVRYRVLADRRELPDPTPHIGGEIQIHGDGIDGNWTWGCIALRNSDMDRLFSLPFLGQGTMVVIVGAELTPDDILNDYHLPEQEQQLFMHHLVELGLAGGHSRDHWLYGLCKYQAEHGLLVTGVFDRATRKTMERQLQVSGRKSAPANP